MISTTQPATTRPSEFTIEVKQGHYFVNGKDITDLVTGFDVIKEGDGQVVRLTVRPSSLILDNEV